MIKLTKKYYKNIINNINIKQNNITKIVFTFLYISQNKFKFLINSEIDGEDGQ